MMFLPYHLNNVCFVKPCFAPVPTSPLKLCFVAVQVRRLEEERDGLQADVEALCLQSQGSSMFSHSRVLAERVAAAEKELKDARAKVR